MRPPESSKSRRSRRTKKKKPADPTANLPDEILVTILSRLPVRSLVRCKSVSHRWRALLSHDADHRRALARTLLPGLFYDTLDSRRFPAEARHFTHVWEGSGDDGDRHRPLVHPSLSFLPRYDDDRTVVLDCCNGLLLCRFSQSENDVFRYVVCNPAEESVTVLPDSGCGAQSRVARLAFDPPTPSSPSPAVTYCVLEFVRDEDGEEVLGANIFSSATGAWIYKESGWSADACLFNNARSAFFNGSLHLFSGSAEILVVDVEGNTWRTIRLPADADWNCVVPGWIGVYKEQEQEQEQLCYVGEIDDSYDLSIWVLEDYTNGGGPWINKRQLSVDMLCQKQLTPHKSCSKYCDVIGILQDGGSFLLYVAGRTLMAYDMDGERVHAIQDLERGAHPPFFLYVPFYTEDQ